MAVQLAIDLGNFASRVGIQHDGDGAIQYIICSSRAFLIVNDDKCECCFEPPGRDDDFPYAELYGFKHIVGLQNPGQVPQVFRDLLEKQGVKLEEVDDELVLRFHDLTISGREVLEEYLRWLFMEVQAAGVTPQALRHTKSKICNTVPLTARLPTIDAYRDTICKMWPETYVQPCYEPVAASISCIDDFNNPERNRIVAFDGGHGTWDFSLCDIGLDENDELDVQVMRTRAVTDCAGITFSKALLDLINSKIAEENDGMKLEKLTLHEMHRAKHIANAKLATADAQPVKLSTLLPTRTGLFKQLLNHMPVIDHEDLMAAYEEPLQIFKAHVQKFWEEVQQDNADFSRPPIILMVGGASKTLGIGKAFRECVRVGWNSPIHGADPTDPDCAEKMVVAGAMRLMKAIDEDEAVNAVNVHNCTSSRFGIVVTDHITDDEVAHLIIDRNTALPAQATNTKTLVTHKLQRLNNNMWYQDLQVVEGDFEDGQSLSDIASQVSVYNVKAFTSKCYRGKPFKLVMTVPEGLKSVVLKMDINGHASQQTIQLNA